MQTRLTLNEDQMKSLQEKLVVLQVRVAAKNEKCAELSKSKSELEDALQSSQEEAATKTKVCKMIINLFRNTDLRISFFFLNNPVH